MRGGQQGTQSQLKRMLFLAHLVERYSKVQNALFDLVEPSPLAGTWVYVIGAEGSSVVKIGKAGDLTERLAAIQTGNPELLTVRWAVAGGRSLEADLHETFKPLRLVGEWFDFGELDPVEQVHAAVKRLRSGYPLVVFGGLQYTQYPPDDDPHRHNPKYQPDPFGCRLMTPTELFRAGYGSEETGRYWRVTDHSFCPFGEV